MGAFVTGKDVYSLTESWSFSEEAVGLITSGLGKTNKHSIGGLLGGSGSVKLLRRCVGVLG